MNVLTWHIHGSYLWYLSHTPVQWWLPVKPGRPEGYGARAGSFPWPGNVHEVPAEEVRDLDLDVVLTQSVRNWEVDRHELLGARVDELPRVHIEHDPPRQSPFEQRHPVDDPDALLVHVTHFNDLVWDSGRTPTKVIEHGVVVPEDVEPTYELERAIVVANGLGRRGRRLGADVVASLQAAGVPLDVVGMLSEEVGGLGEVPPPQLAAFLAPYRCYVHPVRWTSLGLSVCEAMQLGLPVVGLACTELPAVVQHGVTGYLSTSVTEVEGHVRRLLADRDEAAELGAAARAVGRERFGIARFARDWSACLHEAAGVEAPEVAA